MSKTAAEPTGVRQVITPSGLELYKQDGPKRLYRVNGEDRPSVTEVLKVLGIPLQWWGMEIGVRAVQELSRRLDSAYAVLEQDPDTVVQMLTAEKLTVNHDFAKEATKKGTNVHKALEAFAENGIAPDPRFYPEGEQGFIQALVNFINDANPQSLHSELLVGSRDGWAGTLDWVANIDGEVVTKTYQQREDVRTHVSGKWLLDAKTSSEKPGKPKSVYPSYHLQLAAYWRGMGECGYGVPDMAGVIRLTNDARYELVECRAIYQDFVDVLTVSRIIERIKGK